MRGLLVAACAAAMSLSVLSASPNPAPQIGVEVGPPPVCPYGYYDVAPYNCAPAGYYGPEWFNDGVFIGVGPWYHGRDDFHGWVDNRFHPDHGYKGPYPARGERAEEGRRVNKEHFKGNEMRDGHGRVVQDHEKH